jgi:serine/threonine-protein kinase
VDSVVALIDALRESQILEPDQVTEVSRFGPIQFQDPKALTRDLVKRGWLTAFQARQILAGQCSDLIIGPYKLIDQLGEGGMGQVFKALHHHMGRIVALKVVRQELIAEEKALRRFQREVRATAQLSHPNIVTVFDADKAGSVHYLAMEFIDGSDLSVLVRETGPQPVATACDYIRQAALGLHHAHQCGLIHRDVKPSNLLVTRSPQPGIVKILDLGLACPARLTGDDPQGSVLTLDGTVVGTPDYMAPEQAKNSRGVDHRADLYSLGCTLYYLLTARLPFPDGNALEKLLKHQTDAPYPIELIRPDVPEGVLAIVARMTAKSPADRYQSGDEVARALEPYCAGVKAPGSQPILELVPIEPGTLTTPLPAVPAGRSTASEFKFNDSAPIPMPSPRQSPPIPRNRLGLIAGIAGGLFFLALIVVAVAARRGLSRNRTAKDTTAAVVSEPKREPAAPKVTARPAFAIPATAQERLAACIADEAGMVAVANVRQILAAPGIQRNAREWLDPIVTQFALADFDPRTRVDWLAISIAASDSDRFLIALEGRFDATKLTTWLAQSSAAIKDTNVEGGRILKVYEGRDRDNPQARYLAILGETILGVSSDPELLVHAHLRLLGHRMPAPLDSALTPLPALPIDDSIELTASPQYRVDTNVLSQLPVLGLRVRAKVGDDLTMQVHCRVRDIDAFNRSLERFRASVTSASLRIRPLRPLAELLRPDRLRKDIPFIAVRGERDVKLTSMLSAKELDALFRSVRD